MSRTEAHGVCPHCQAYTGPVGTPCIRAACAEGPYHCIPVDWYDATRAYSARKSRPIDPRVGRMVDKYLLCANLGEGGMGSVYVAIQKPLFREVALKLIADVELTKHAVGRFEREARAISLLDHPNIVKIYDYGVTLLERKMPFMVLEYLRHGRTLRKAIGSLRTGETVDAAVVLRIFQQVLNALGAAHTVGIIHRDVKPENIMVLAVHGDPYFVKVLDFGLARLESDETNFEGEDLAAGRLVGTPYYMAPEQIPTRKNASKTVDGRADLYAVAVMLYEILTGTRPFEASDPLGVLARKMDPEMDPLALPAAQNLTKAQRNLLTKGLARDPEQRFANAAEMAQALDQALNPTSRVVGLVVIGSEESSDRVVPPPGSDPNIATPAGADASMPGGRSAPPDATPSTATPIPAPPTSPSVPRPLEPPPEGLPFPSPGLEIDLPEVSTAPWARPGPIPSPAHPPPPAPPGPRPSTVVHPVPRPDASRHPGSPSVSRTRPDLRRWVVALGALAAILVLIPVGISWWRLNRVQEELSALSQHLVRQGHFVGVTSPRIRSDPGGYVVMPEDADPRTAEPIRDPWGMPYRVTLDVRRGVYMLRSWGPDRDAGICREQEEGGDDFCRDLGPP